MATTNQSSSHAYNLVQSTSKIQRTPAFCSIWGNLQYEDRCWIRLLLQINEKQFQMCGWFTLIFCQSLNQFCKVQESSAKNFIPRTKECNSQQNDFHREILLCLLIKTVEDRFPPFGCESTFCNLQKALSPRKMNIAENVYSGRWKIFIP